MSRISACENVLFGVAVMFVEVVGRMMEENDSPTRESFCRSERVRDL